MSDSFEEFIRTYVPHSRRHAVYGTYDYWMQQYGKSMNEQPEQQELPNQELIKRLAIELCYAQCKGYSHESVTEEYLRAEAEKFHGAWIEHAKGLQAMLPVNVSGGGHAPSPKADTSSRDPTAECSNCGGRLEYRNGYWTHV